MCGIIITKDLNKLDSIKHRGIEFSKIISDNGIIYGHHRLPIQTLLNDGWEQPIPLNKSDFFMFNGEIFNYDKSLYDSDSSYLKDFFLTSPGIDDIIRESSKWDGFWSIVYKKNNEHIVFTDPLGKKQLYYNRAGEISSEIKKLSCTKKMDNLFISTVNKWGYNTDNGTIWEDVKRIMPNRIYIFNSDLTNHTVSYQPYYKWYDDSLKSKSIYELLDESVRNRLVSKKYKVSTLFSGGLDSTIILYFLRKYGSDIDIYSIENEEDEEYIRFIEKEWGLNINFIGVNPNDISHDEIMKIYDINDSMIDLGSVIPQYYLFKDIKNKIVLTGDGADELFSGYRRAKIYDSQETDIFHELSFYHLVRIDRMSMNFTIECRNPFLSHDIIKKALSLSWQERIGKKILKDEFRGLIPDKIIDRAKNPLKIKSIRDNEEEYRRGIINQYIQHVNKNK